MNPQNAYNLGLALLIINITLSLLSPDPKKYALFDVITTSVVLTLWVIGQWK